jgi:hypothetical protein
LVKKIKKSNPKVIPNLKLKPTLNKLYKKQIKTKENSTKNKKETK